MAPSTPVTRRPSKKSSASNGASTPSRAPRTPRTPRNAPTAGLPNSSHTTPAAPTTPRTIWTRRSQAVFDFLEKIDIDEFKMNVRYDIKAIENDEVRRYVSSNHKELLLWFCSLERTTPSREDQKEDFVNFMKENLRDNFRTPPRTTARVFPGVSDNILCDDCNNRHRRDDRLRFLDEARVRDETSESVMFSSGDFTY